MGGDPLGASLGELGGDMTAGCKHRYTSVSRGRGHHARMMPWSLGRRASGDCGATAAAPLGRELIRLVTDSWRGVVVSRERW